MSDLEDAVIEWRDARQAFHDTQGQGVAAFTPEMWTRMADAEHRLMTLARELRR